MHVRCIAEKALKETRELNTVPNSLPTAKYFIIVDEQAEPKRSSKAQKKKGKLKNPTSNPNVTAVAFSSKGDVSAEVFVKGHPDRPNHEPAEEDEIIITTEDHEQYSEDVCCLFCGTEIA